MRGSSNWSYEPFYRPFFKKDELDMPYICRIAPAASSVKIDWKFTKAYSDASFFYKKRDNNEWNCIKNIDSSVTVKNLEIEHEYKCYIETDGVKSPERIFKTGDVPGTVVNYIHPEDKAYAFSGFHPSSPCLLRLKNGSLLASCDIYGPRRPQNLTIIYRSDDNGESWYHYSELMPCFWGQMFYLNDTLYMLAFSTENGDILIGKSDDDGKTWGTPAAIFRGSCTNMELGFQRAPFPPVEHNGRLWVGIEICSWVLKSLSNAVLSIALGDDPLVPENWTMGDIWHYNSSVDGSVENAFGALESNFIVDNSGKLLSISRYAKEKAIIMNIDTSNPEAAPEFVKYASFPMAHTKFEIVKAPNSKYYAVGNRLPLRNILSLYTSDDLENWNFEFDIINRENEDEQLVGFQYPSILIDGHDLIMFVRTAYNGANSFHNGNYVTFHRLKNLF